MFTVGMLFPAEDCRCPADCGCRDCRERRIDIYHAWAFALSVLTIWAILRPRADRWATDKISHAFFILYARKRKNNPPERREVYPDYNQRPHQDMQPTAKYTFSGHESFACKSLWLKKGYDFIKNGHNFNAPDAVVRLGVGKNMVASIRYWMKVFGMTRNDLLTDTARLLLDTGAGFDPYLEDLGTLWLLHYLLVVTKEATLYHLLFTRLQKERLSFDRQHLLSLAKRAMTEDGKLKSFNENTVRKDINVLLSNYVLPQNTNNTDEYAALLIDLDLIRTTDGKTFLFNIEGKRPVPPDLFLYAILNEKGNDNSVDYDTLQNIGLVFCMNDIETVTTLTALQEQYPDHIRYSDTAGVRQLQFTDTISPETALAHHFSKQ